MEEGERGQRSRLKRHNEAPMKQRSNCGDFSPTFVALREWHHNSKAKGGTDERHSLKQVKKNQHDNGRKSSPSEEIIGQRSESRLHGRGSGYISTSNEEHILQFESTKVRREVIVQHTSTCPARKKLDKKRLFHVSVARGWLRTYNRRRNLRHVYVYSSHGRKTRTHYACPIKQAIFGV